MNYALKIQLGFALLGIAEAWLEVVVIALKNPSLLNYNTLNRREHQRSAVYWLAMVAVFISVAPTWQTDIYLVPALIFNRRVFFEYALKIFRPGKRMQNIEGNMFWDNLSRSLLGKRGGYYELAICIAVIIALNKLFLL